DGTRDDVPKYLNCTKTVTYDKSLNLYRPSQQALDPDAQVIVCEGTLDALAIAATAASVGLSAKFAPVVESGLAISEAQWDTILAIHPGSVVLCADGDKAGRRTNAQWAAELAKRGRDSVITFWPDRDDPASYFAKHGPAGLASVTRAEANRPLDDPRRRMRTYPVPAAPARAILLAEVAKKIRASGRSGGSTTNRSSGPLPNPSTSSYNCTSNRWGQDATPSSTCAHPGYVIGDSQD
ncbi:toprim domain-containing protein, partial [Ferrimicrobium sp.]|uniref:toprim domain-containing protein n=1 Tax=Ferrimicrobium sp. TaxID=2926050 RepID=UPI0026125503